MGKKIKLSLYISLIIIISITLLILNIDRFVSATIRLTDIKDINNLNNIFQIYNNNKTSIYNEHLSEVKEGINSFFNTLNKEFNLKEFLGNLFINCLRFLTNFLIYFCNYGLNLILISYIFFKETINATNLKIKTTPLAYLYIKINNTLVLIKERIRNLLIKTHNILIKNKDKVILLLFITLLSSAILYQILIELLIFIITYIRSVINLETYLLILDILKSIFIFLFPKITKTPKPILITLLIILVFLKAISRALYKLKKNHERLAKFASEDLTQTTFINGPPGTGKTLLNVSLSLISEENYIKELREYLLNYELAYKNLNFAKIRENTNLYPEHKDYIKTYNLLYQRSTFIISNYTIFSPYFQTYSKIFDFNYLRVNKKTDIYPLEEYIIISLSEFDKEYNSHDDKKAVGEDGAATFFSTVSHNLKRHTKIFVDYQLKDQVPLRIRGNAEYFITIKKRQKKYPILLYLYYLPFKLIFKIIKTLIKKYETKTTKLKNSNRVSLPEIKRNDLTLLYLILRNLAYSLNKIDKFFQNFYYFKLDINLSQEGDEIKPTKKKICINIRDLNYKGNPLYDSTFLSYAYKEKKNEDFKNLPTFSNLTPPIEELNKCNSRFYNKINNQ